GPTEPPGGHGPDDPVHWEDRPLFRELESRHPHPGSDSGPRFEDPDEVQGHFQKKYEGFLGLLSSRLEVHDTGNVSEYLRQENKFRTEEALHLKVVGPLTLFGQAGANSDSLDSQGLKLKGKTGLVWKWAGWPLGEVQVRGGPAVNYDDPHRPERMKEQ